MPKKVVEKFGLAGHFENIVRDDGVTEGVFRAFGAREIHTSRGETFRDAFEFKKARRQQAIRWARRKPRAKRRRQEIGASQAEVAEFLASCEEHHQPEVRAELDQIEVRGGGHARVHWANGEVTKTRTNDPRLDEIRQENTRRANQATLAARWHCKVE
jgi:hypothetical protein